MLWKALTSSAILLATLSSVTLVAGIPATDPSSCLPTSNTTSPSPQFVVYSDNWVTGTLPNVSQVEGYTVFALSFLLSTGAVDQAQGWAQLDENTRNELKSKYNAAGIKVVVSAFGSTETPTTAGADATKVAGDMATWVKQYGLDGIDVDYEDLAAMNAGDGKAGGLPQGQYILTHAPLAPWFSTQGFKSGAYLTVNKNVGDMIDWYNIQFYNQNEYNDCNAKAKGWSGGAMVWQYPHADATWIKTVRSQSWAVGQ
ncbi:chitinase [Phellopilus nigrolimitatus]|nr:chitinase [Phellopilus nigrolimitatus]